MKKAAGKGSLCYLYILQCFKFIRVAMQKKLLKKLNFLPVHTREELCIINSTTHTLQQFMHRFFRIHIIEEYA